MNVVFDFGGVLLAWQPHELIARLLPHRSATAEDAHALTADFFEGFGGDWAEFDRGTLAREPLAERIAARTGLTLEQTHAVIDAVPGEWRESATMDALIDRLAAAGHALYFLSNMPAPYADHLDVRPGFIGRFRAGVFSARVGMIKPDREIFEHAARTFGIAPRDTLFIDDVLHNAEAARAAGWQALHFVDPQQCEAELVARGLLPASPPAP